MQALLKPKERKESTEVVTHSAEAIAHMVTYLEKEFAKSSEGLEALYLKQILEHYLNNIDNFLAHFVSGVPGQRGVDVMINGLEHPESKVKADKKLIKEIKKLRDSLKKENIPNLAEWKHYTELRRRASELKPETDIHVFKDNLDALLVAGIKYPKTAVGKIINEYSSKKTPRIIEVEDFELAVLVWKMVLSRLCLPDDIPQQKIVRGLLGSMSPKVVENEIVTKLSIAAKRSREIAELAPGIAGGISSVFRTDLETGNWDNLKGLAAASASKTKSYLFRLMCALGQDKYTEYLIGLFGKEGKQLDQPKTVKTIAGIIVRLDKEKQEIQISAKDELLGIIDSMLKDMHKNLSKERDEFAKLLRDRVEELEHSHAKDLENVQKMKAEMNEMFTKMIYGYINVSDLNETAVKLLTSQREFTVRTTDILALMRARTAARRLMINAPNFRYNDFTEEITKVLSSEQSAFAENMIRKIQQLVDRMMQNSVTAEVFETGMKNIDDFIDKLGAQIPLIINSQKVNSDKLLDVAKQAETTITWLDFNIKKAEDKAVADARKIRNIGLTEEKITSERREELNSEDIKALNIRKTT